MFRFTVKVPQFKFKSELISPSLDLTFHWQGCLLFIGKQRITDFLLINSLSVYELANILEISLYLAIKERGELWFDFVLAYFTSG